MIRGSDIREARNRAGMSQEALAQAVGVTLRTIGNWERSSTAPREKLPILRTILGDYLKTAEIESPRLRGASDEELLNEIARRLDRTQQKAGEGHDRSAPPIGDDWPEAEVTDLRRQSHAGAEPVRKAARTGQSTRKAQRQAQDDAATASQDPDDWNTDE